MTWKKVVVFLALTFASSGMLRSLPMMLYLGEKPSKSFKLASLVSNFVKLRRPMPPPMEIASHSPKADAFSAFAGIASDCSNSSTLYHYGLWTKWEAYKKLEFPSTIVKPMFALGESLKSVIPAWSEAILTKATGATSTALLRSVRKETTRKTVKTPIWKDLAFLLYSLIRYDTIDLKVGQHLTDLRICLSVRLRAIETRTLFLRDFLILYRSTSSCTFSIALKSSFSKRGLLRASASL